MPQKLKMDKKKRCTAREKMNMILVRMFAVNTADISHTWHIVYCGKLPRLWMGEAGSLHSLNNVLLAEGNKKHGPAILANIEECHHYHTVLFKD